MIGFALRCQRLIRVGANRRVNPSYSTVKGCVNIAEEAACKERLAELGLSPFGAD
jgi:hypothetical protein